MILLSLKLGIKPFDSRLTADWLQQQIGRRKKAIKECLLEQKTVAGIGNIYGDENRHTEINHFQNLRA
ncbi:MAG: hypothetical protein Q4C52_06135 [Eubacteriales bacterium]|nr:hypothetical protein [Eubacteriales bacterium]